MNYLFAICFHWFSALFGHLEGNALYENDVGGFKKTYLANSYRT